MYYGCLLLQPFLKILVVGIQEEHPSKDKLPKKDEEGKG